MTPIKFKEAQTTLAEKQPQYQPLPVNITVDERSPIMTSCWQLTIRERIKVLLFGKVWCQQMTFGQLLQPQLLSIDKPEMKIR